MYLSLDSVFDYPPKNQNHNNNIRDLDSVPGGRFEGTRRLCVEKSFIEIQIMAGCFSFPCILTLVNKKKKPHVIRLHTGPVTQMQ
ncbi:hypothetical protein VTN49DRAFT_648 [Thermomyces lanuginosus]|uniref:uncharacterized protein n=1 Tax=Thermomyces lanuginosus TaxID=5541 RepID=UPI0037443472